jgi:Zn-dependent protease with chaperone function
MDEEALKIFRAFDGKLIGNEKMKLHVCETLALMPQNIISTITKTCWFVSSFEDAWAFTFTGNDLEDQHLIFLSDALLAQDTHQIQYTIAHEIGHVVLGHRNAILASQTSAEVKKQEEEADDFTHKFIER